MLGTGRGWPTIRGMDRSAREQLSALATPHPEYDDLVCIEVAAIEEAGLEESSVRALMNETGGWVECSPTRSGVARLLRLGSASAKPPSARYVLRKAAIDDHGSPGARTVRRVQRVGDGDRLRARSSVAR